MQRCLIAHTNLAAATGASVSVDAVASGKVATRLTDGVLGVRCWLDNHTGTITVDLGNPATYGAKQWNLVALLGTNLTADMTVVAQANDSDSWGSPAWSQIMDYESRSYLNRQNNIWHYSSTAMAYRYVRFSIEEGGAPILADAFDAVLGGSSVSFPTYAKFGQVVVANALQVGHNFSHEYSTEDYFGLRVHQTEEATRAYQTTGARRSWQLSWRRPARMHREEIEEAWGAIAGSAVPFLIIPEPDDDARFASWVRGPQSLTNSYSGVNFVDRGEMAFVATEEPYATEILTEE